MGEGGGRGEEGGRGQHSIITSSPEQKFGTFFYDTDHKCHTNEHNDYFSIVDKWYRTRYYTRRKNVKLTPIFVGHYMC